MAATIDKLRELGYELGIASGDSTVEQTALDKARAAASPDVLVGQANQVTRESLSQLSAAGQLPPEGEPRKQLAEQIAAAALDSLSARADATVTFHERALEHAKNTPTVFHVAGHGITTYVAVDDETGKGADKPAQQLLDSLAAAAG